MVTLALQGRIDKMVTLNGMRKYGRLAWELRSLLRHPISLETAQTIVQRRLAERDINFLRLVERAVFGYPRSPYLPLLKLARCELGDIKNMLRAQGLDGTLRALRDSGVYITFEEFKGRTPIVRNGHVLSVRSRDFNNPHLSNYYHAESGGTTGQSTRVLIALDHHADRAPLKMLAFHAHGILNVPTAIWRSLDNTGLSNILDGAVFGQIPQKWFLPFTNHTWKFTKAGLTNNYVISTARLFAPIPRPEPVSLDHAGVIAHWGAKTLKAHGACLIRTTVSQAARVGIAAQEEGLDLTGATFTVGGEPPTPAKVREITRTGARVVPTYGCSEIGLMGFGCARPADCNDIHFFRDSFAVIQSPRQIPGWDMRVDALYFTSLLPSTPVISLNVESDDYGLVETRTCGCPLERYGFTEHLRHIRSFRKLTTEGGNVLGSDMIRILEEVLPARFGGTPLDYQLVEEEDDTGFTRVNLLVSPRVSCADEAAVIGAVLEHLTAGERARWTQAKTLRVKRMDPKWTPRGKLMPLHLCRGASDRPSDTACTEHREGTT